MTDSAIMVVGAGRMGRGIAQAYAVAGTPVQLIDLKQRTAKEFDQLAESVRADIHADLRFAVDLGYLAADEVDVILDRVTVCAGDQTDGADLPIQMVYEALPETLDHKQSAFDWVGRRVPEDVIVASTTSTLDVNELAGLIDRPSRFLNAHWLNPAHLMPLVEVAVGAATSESTFASVADSLRRIGKVPVRCTASPGYIVPRIQALAMNEAARLVEEGVASAEEVDLAVRVGFGLRFAVLGLVEFIDWGGNDILYYASRHLSRTVDEHRYRAPDIVESYMQSGRNGLREGKGFYDYDQVDVDAYRRERLQRFLEMVEHSCLLPVGLGRRASENAD